MFKITTKSDNSAFVENVWSILYLCINETLQDFSSWTFYDDLLEELMHRLGLESCKTTSIVYLMYLNKFLSIPKKLNEFERTNLQTIVNTAISRDSYEPFIEWLESVRKHVTAPNYYCFRWSKKLMMLILNESFKIGGDKESILIHLHVCINKFNFCQNR